MKLSWKLWLVVLTLTILELACIDFSQMRTAAIAGRCSGVLVRDIVLVWVFQWAVKRAKMSRNCAK